LAARAPNFGSKGPQATIGIGIDVGFGERKR
jgi:hypothetical protein